MNSINEDTEIWRQRKDDAYSPSIHITKDGLIGINVGGLVHTGSIEELHKILGVNS